MQPSTWRIRGLNREQRQHETGFYIYEVLTALVARQCQALLLAHPPSAPPGSADAVLIITRMYFRAGYLFSLLMMCKSG